MKTPSPCPKQDNPREARRGCGFTLIELLVVIAVIGVLAGILLPVLARAKAAGQATICLNNTKQLLLAWHLYADENEDRLPYNLGGDVTRKTVAKKSPLNWVNGVMSWNADPDNTNAALIAQSSLAAYTSGSPGLYKCPSDRVLSDEQRNAGWDARVRSYSMNAMIGDAGETSPGGTNRNNPEYLQFLELSAIPDPAGIFVFLDEHPDSIDDGYFVNNAEDVQWVDLPASYHNGAASVSFADGHSELHRWVNSMTQPPPRPDAAMLPLSIPPGQRTDFYWLTIRTSVERSGQW